MSSYADQLPSRAQMKRMQRYFPRIRDIINGNPCTAESIRFVSANYMFLDYDDLFDRFMQQCDFLKISKDANLEMKKKNTIAEPWPMRLGENTTVRDFSIMCASNHLGCERYVEWKRID